MKVLIVGLGSIAKKHVVAIRKLTENVDLYALRSAEDSPIFEKVINLFTEKQIAEHNFDFAIISNPTSEHKSAISMLLGLKIPLFIEKPLFDVVGLQEKELLSKMELLQIPTYVACNLRFLDSIQFIKKEVEDKRINEVNIYCGTYLPDWRPGENFRKSYSANIEMGGGVHIDLIHELDYTFWLFGAPLRTDSLFTSCSSLEISSFDYANYRWQYKGFTANVVLNYYRKDPKRSLEIVCEQGTYYVNLLKNEVSFNSDIIFTSEQKIADTYETQMNFFLTNILTGNELDFNTAFEAYQILNYVYIDLKK